MRYQYLLYSRSLRVDYRWLIVPPDVSPDDLSSLSALYDLSDLARQKSRTAGVPSVYCLRLSSIIALVECGHAGHEDAFGRPIHCMQGIAVSLSWAKGLCLILPYLLERHARELNVWGLVDFEDADRLTRSTLPDGEFGLDSIGQRMGLDSARKVPGIHPHIESGGQIQLPFSPDGYRQLIETVASPHVALVDFAFGATAELVGAFRSFRVIAWAKPGPGCVSATPSTPLAEGPLETSPKQNVFEDSEIKLSPIPRRLFGVLGRNRYKFVAAAVRNNRTYVAGESMLFDFDPASPVSHEPASRILADFMDRLTLDRWQLKSDRGQYWWSYRLQRRIR